MLGFWETQNGATDAENDGLPKRYAASDTTAAAEATEQEEAATELAKKGQELLLIFDDYGLDNPWKGVKEAIDDYLFFPNFKIIKEIGEPKGSDCNPRVNLKEVEGLICSWTNE